MTKPIIFCASIPQEVRPLCRRLGMAAPSPSQRIVEGRSHEGYAVRVAVSGVGRERMTRLLEDMKYLPPVLCWVSVGLAGGLSPGLAVGDCLIGHAVMAEKDEIYSFNSLPGHSVSDTKAVPSDILFCSNRAVCLPADKIAVFRETGASAVDMESAAVARFARQRNESFTWIRVISDTADDEIPREMMECLNADGFPSVRAAMRVLLSHPGQLFSFLRYGIRSRQCATRMAEAIIPWMLFYHTPSRRV